MAPVLHSRGRLRSRKRHFARRLVLPVVVVLLPMAGIMDSPAQAVGCTGDAVVATASASSELNTTTWPAANIHDGNLATAWSSDGYSTATATEWLTFTFAAPEDINYVKLRPRWFNGAQVGFPTSFRLYYLNSAGTAWVAMPNTSYANFPAPSRDEWLVLPLTQQVTTTAIHMVSDVMSPFGSPAAYWFQIAEATAGCNPEFGPSGHWRYLGRHALPNANYVVGMDAGQFNPNKLTSWHHDYRGPLIASKPGDQENIYAPSVVWDAPNSRWNVYFGGWDGTSDTPAHDRVSFLNTYDDFATFTQHYMIIDHGIYKLVNNPNVVKTGPSSWRMIYTVLPGSDQTKNKPHYSVSSDGVTWTPDEASAFWKVNMTGDSDWAGADVNGSNATYFDGTTWHYYYNNLNPATNTHCTWAGGTAPCGVFHATSTDGANFTYQGMANNEAACAIVQDVKQFTYNSTSYYLGGYHCNTGAIWKTVSTSLTNFGSTSVVFTRPTGFDMPTMGWVTRDNKLLGALYGGNTYPGITPLENDIYASWLQKHATFTSTDSTVTHNSNFGYGPNAVVQPLTGQTGSIGGTMKIYDTDGTTLLYTSPTFTMRPGDSWQYVP